jgi:hypothetical protein
MSPDNGGVIIGTDFLSNAIADRRQGVVLQLWGWARGLTTPHPKTSLLINVTRDLRIEGFF